jgi:BCD family chlorophyll transporter-like MFS transporter
MQAGFIGWFGIVRLGLVQMALGGIIALATSTLNRVMVVELALPATLPGLLFGIHYAAEMLRPRWGHGSDKGGKRTPWIIGGMAVLAISGVCAAASIALMSTNTPVGIVCAVFAYIGIGIGAGAAGTSLLVLVAKLTSPARKPTAAAVVWTMMIAGTAIAARGGGGMLDPFTMTRLVSVSGAISVICFTLAVIAIWGIERRYMASEQANPQKQAHSFIEAMRDVWAEPEARRMTIFIFISMLAFSAQELLLEPFAGAVFGLTPGETAKLFGSHRAGIVLGMVLGAVVGSLSRRSPAAARFWVAGGCFASSLGLFALASVGIGGLTGLLKPVVFALGMANGTYAVAAIGTMISLASVGKGAREGVRMGLWGAAQAIAFGFGGVIGTAAVDVARHFLGTPSAAYSLLFAVQGVLFVFATGLAVRLTAATALPAQDQDSELSYNTSAQAVGEAGARMT